MTLLQRLFSAPRTPGAVGPRTMSDWATMVEQHQRMVATLASVRAVEPPAGRRDR